VHLFIYNPYSIVNERWIAKIDAERNPSIVSTADTRGLACHCGFGGADRARTDDPLLAKQVLSQLSYSPGS
jgi:hypothetical protein